MLWIVPVVLVIVLVYAIIDKALDIHAKKFASEQEEKKTKEMLLNARKPFYEPPPGWTIEYNTVTGRFRWKRKNGIGGFSCKTKREAIDAAWEQVIHEDSNAAKNWEPILKEKETK